MPQYPLNRTYKALFTEFNRRFFDGRLPNCRIVVVPCIITQSWVHGKIYRRQRLIKILERPDHDDMASILIHEMAHAATTDAHGPRFYAEMKRLQQMGAPVQDYELNPLPRLTKGLVRAAAEDAIKTFYDNDGYALEKLAKITWHAQALAHLAGDDGNYHPESQHLSWLYGDADPLRSVLLSEGSFQTKPKVH